MLHQYRPSYIHRLGSVCLHHLGEALIGRNAYRNKQSGPSKTQATLQKEERSNLVMLLVSTARSTYILFRLLVEGLLASERAEVIRLPVVFGRAGGSVGINIHVAYRVMYGGCHKLVSVSFLELCNQKTSSVRAVLLLLI